jgi:PKD repeat protein
MVPRSSAFVRTIALTLTAIIVAGPSWAKGPSEGAPIAVGDLAVETDPYGAAVFVDGRAAGATPVTVSGLTAGEHRVRVVKSGYLENARVITVVAGKPTAVKVKLTRNSETSAEAGQVTSTGGGGGGGGMFSNKWIWVAAAGAGVAAVAVLATRNAAPVPGTITAPASALQGANVRFSSTGSSDPDGDALTLNWDFGDGGTGTGANPTHAYTRAGSFTVTLTVSDAKHKVTAPSLTVNVKSLTATWRGPLRGSTTFNTVVPLTQNGTSLSGSYTDQAGGAGSTVTGSVDPSNGAVTFTVTVPGFAPWTFTGTVDGDVNNLNGVANGSGFSNAAWTLSRG